MKKKNSHLELNNRREKEAEAHQNVLDARNIGSNSPLMSPAGRRLRYAVQGIYGDRDLYGAMGVMKSLYRLQSTVKQFAYGS